MVDDESSQIGSAPQGGVSPTVTRVPWGAVTGVQLEELLHGLLDAMGARSLVWRAGSATGVTASDGGRDLEAVFDRPSPDGELDRLRWWIECKGRSGTVEPIAVKEAVMNASGRTDIDVLVVASNSRFSNPTRDWLEEWTNSHPRPMVKLWDRDHLDRLVRQYPTVVARTFPQALDDKERLELLAARFFEFGEGPTEQDLDYFWERRDWLTEQEPGAFTRAVAMFLYVEGVPLQRIRQWWRLLRVDDVPNALVAALIDLPKIVFDDDLPRPAEDLRVIASAARIVISCLSLAPDSAATLLNPWAIVKDGEEIAGDAQQVTGWQEFMLLPVLTFVQGELIDACSDDCSRVTADNPHEVESFSSTELWDAYFRGTDSEKQVGTIVGEWSDRPCTIGLNMDSGCPLVSSNPRACTQLVEEVVAILRFRRESPDHAAVEDDEPGDEDAVTLTILTDHGMAGTVTEDD